MARKKKDEVELPEIVPGSQEDLTRQHFAKEKAAYEKRTGETVTYELDAPVTSTPVEEETPAETQDEPAEAEGEG